MVKLWKHLTFTITPFAHLLDLFKTLRVFINKKSVFADWINWKGNIYQWKYDCVRNSIYDSPLSQKIPGCWSATLLRKYSITTAFRIMLWKFEGQSSLTTLAYSPMPKKDSEADKTNTVFVHRSGMHYNPATLEAVFRSGVSSVPVGEPTIGGELCDHL